MKTFPWVLPLVLGLFALLGSGCVTSDDNYEQTSAPRRTATFLTLVDESHQLTPEQLEERRRNIISYLVSEGYIYSGEDLVQNSSFADQIIRARLALDGSFELTIYRPEHISRREFYFDPAGYPSYMYYPGDIGYIGDGIAPYYFPLTPYRGPRHHGDRDRHDHDNNNGPDHRPPSGQNPDWNRNHQPPRNGVNDRDHDDRPPSGNRPDRDKDHRDKDHRDDPRRNHNAPQPPTTPAQPPQTPNQPNPPRHGPRDNDRRPVNPPQTPVNPPALTPPTPQGQTGTRHQGPNRQPSFNPAPQPAAPSGQPAPQPPSTQPQPDHRHFRPELQRPDNTTRQPSAPDSSVNRTRPDRPSPQPSAQPRPEPPRRDNPPPRPDPTPARDDSNKSDPAPARTETQTRSDPPPRNDPPDYFRRR